MIGPLAVDVSQQTLFGITNQPPDFSEGWPLSAVLVLLHAPLSQLRDGHLKNFRYLFLRIHSQWL